MAAKNLICIVVDRLHAGMLGAYGNSWIRSRELDRLASISFLFDQAYVESPRLDHLYRAYWQGQSSTDQPHGGPSFPRLLSEHGWHTVLVSDEPRLADFAATKDFAEQHWVETPPARKAASQASNTQTARLFDRAVEWLSVAREPFCLWIHARAMEGAWDAPQDMRAAYADEEDPAPPEFVEVPNRRLPERFDPDELLGITHAYAGQVALLDACLGGLLDYLQVSGRVETTQLTLLSARGFPLGEHHRVGACDWALYNELVQIAWLMCFPDGLGRLARTQALVQPFDLPLTLLDWLDIGREQFGSPKSASLVPVIRGDQETVRDHVCLVSEADRAIRTAAWMLRQPAEGPSELYAKPSDRWEVNEVSRLCSAVVEGLQLALQEAEQAGQTGQAKPLPDLLVTEVD